MRAYSFQNISVFINGVAIVDFAPDSAVTVRRRVEAITSNVGVDGNMAISIGADRSGELDVVLQQTSPSNAFLGILQATQQASGSTFIPIFMLAKDSSGGDVFTGSKGYIVNLPETTRGREVSTQTWTIVFERVDFVYGIIPESLVGAF
jgi:hypothetical protein